MAIEIVDFPIQNGDFPWQNVSSPEGIPILKPAKKNMATASHLRSVSTPVSLPSVSNVPCDIVRGGSLCAGVEWIIPVGGLKSHGK